MSFTKNQFDIVYFNSIIFLFFFFIKKFSQEKKQTLKHLKSAAVWDMGQNLSVHLNSNKRLVMEKIQVELNTDVSESKSKSCEYNYCILFFLAFFLSFFLRERDMYV